MLYFASNFLLDDFRRFFKDLLKASAVQVQASPLLRLASRHGGCIPCYAQKDHSKATGVDPRLFYRRGGGMEITPVLLCAFSSALLERSNICPIHTSAILQ
jgi:hypothetical protein